VVKSAPNIISSVCHNYIARLRRSCDLVTKLKLSSDGGDSTLVVRKANEATVTPMGGGGGSGGVCLAGKLSIESGGRFCVDAFGKSWFKSP
jgi:hypothetical protein